MRAHLAIALVGLTAGCQSNVRHEAPSTEGAKAALMMAVDGTTRPGVPNSVEIDGRRVTMIETLDLEQEVKLPVFFESDEVEIYYLPWGCNLEALGLSRGTQILGETAAEYLEVPRSLGALIEPRGDGGWRSLDGPVPKALSESFLRMQVTGTACERLAPRYDITERIDLGIANAFPVYAIPFSGATLVGASNGKTVLIDARANVAAFEIPGLASWPIAAQVAADGEVWFFTGAGQIAKGPVRGEKRIFPGQARLKSQRDPAETLVSFVVTKESDPIEAYVVTQDRSLQRYDGSEWTELSRTNSRAWTIHIEFTLGEFNVDGYYLPHLVRLGPTKIATFGVSDRDESVVFVDEGVLTEQSVTDRGYISRLLLHPTLGLLAGDSRGNTFIQGAAGWSKYISGSQVPLTMTDVDGLGAWLFDLNNFITFQPDSGFCYGDQIELSPLQSLQLGPDQWLLVGVDPEGLATPGQIEDPLPPSPFAAVLTRAKPAAGCSAPFSALGP